MKIENIFKNQTRPNLLNGSVTEGTKVMPPEFSEFQKGAPLWIVNNGHNYWAPVQLSSKLGLNY